MALAECAKEALALRSLLGELGYPQESTVLFEDNTTAEVMTQKPTSKAKHIELRWHFLRQLVSDRALTIKHISTAEQVADLLTKPVSADVFRTLRPRLMGPCDSDA